MAKKKTTVTKQGKPAKDNGSNGLSPIKWFSRQLPFLPENEGLTIAHRKENAENDCRQLLKEHPKGKKWMITDFIWEKPGAESEKYKLTVMIKRKKNGLPPAPGDAPIPAQKQPPPSM